MFGAVYFGQTGFGQPPQTGGSIFTKALTGALSFTGSIAKKTLKKATAAISFTGSIRKTSKPSLTASLSFTGSIRRAIKKSLIASLSFSSIFKGFLPPIFNYLSMTINSTPTDTVQGEISIGDFDSSGTISNINTDNVQEKLSEE